MEKSLKEEEEDKDKDVLVGVVEIAKAVDDAETVGVEGEKEQKEDDVRVEEENNKRRGKYGCEVINLWGRRRLRVHF